MARKPAALARELLRNFPKGRRGGKGRRRKKASPSEDGNAVAAAATAQADGTPVELESAENGDQPVAPEPADAGAEPAA
jgi:hypothetical protein